MSRPRLMSLAAGLLAGLALQGCAVGPRFERPAAPVLGAYLPAPANGTPTPAAASAADAPQGPRILLGTEPAEDWWLLFGSASLDALVRQSLTGNHSLAAARARLAQAQELLTARSGARLPQVEGNLGAGRQKYGAQFLGPLSVPPFSYTSFGLAVRYTLDYTGGVSRSIEQQRALAQYQASEAEAARLSLTGSVVSEAIVLASAREQVAAVRGLLDDDRRNADLVREAFTNGSVSRLDVLTAEAQLASDEALLPPLEQQADAAQDALAVLLGHAPAEGVVAAPALAELHVPGELPVSLPSQLVRRRPDILAAEAQLHAATAAVGIATANLYPQVTLTANVGQQSLASQAGHLFDRASTAWGLIGGLTAPLYNGGSLRAERRAALRALDASAERYQQVVLESFGQVADRLAALGHDAQLLAAQQRALARSEESLGLARESYRAGNSGLLQVLDVQRLVQQARLGVLRAQAQQYLDSAQLLLAVGGPVG